MDDLKYHRITSRNGLTTGDIRIIIPKRLDSILDSLVELGIFVNKTDVVRAALIKYLDDMHLLDQLKSSIETHPIDE